MQIFCANGKEAEKTIFESLIRDSDTNGDGELSLKEFTSMMEKFVTSSCK
jgi:Ca2+-binding EF-hand superfamily protein